MHIFFMQKFWKFPIMNSYWENIIEFSGFLIAKTMPSFSLRFFFSNAPHLIALKF